MASPAGAGLAFMCFNVERKEQYAAPQSSCSRHLGSHLPSERPDARSGDYKIVSDVKLVLLDVAVRDSEGAELSCL